MAPVGFRFHPTEEEIIGYYLILKLNGHDSLVDDHIGEIDHLYRWDPWDLPDFERINSDDQGWYFYCRLDCKNSNSKRANRTTENGNWKLTGKVRDIKLGGKDEVICIKKNLVFQCKCPDTKKVVGASCVIHEFQAKTSPPDESPLVLCKLKCKADDLAANSPNDEGEPSRVMGSDVENSAAQINIREVDAEQLPSLIDSQGVDFNFPLPLQSQNHLQNCFLDEEGLTEFADSFFIVPDEYGAENAAFSLPNDYSPPRSSSKAYAGDGSDRTTYHAYEEHSNLFGWHGNSKEYRVQKVHGYDILLMEGTSQGGDFLLMEGSSMGSITATRHELVKSMQSVGEEFPRIHKPLAPPESPSFLEREEVSHKGVQLQCKKISSPVFNHNWESSSGKATDTDQFNDEDIYSTFACLSKLQFRSDVSKAKWNGEMGMAEVIEKKGKMWITIGIVRNGKTFCLIEETLFLAEIGALLVIDDNDECLALKDIYKKIAEEKNGCGWELFEIYKHLKSLGYIVGRHGVPWSMKRVENNRKSCSSQGAIENNKVVVA